MWLLFTALYQHGSFNFKMSETSVETQVRDQQVFKVTVIRDHEMSEI